MHSIIKIKQLIFYIVRYKKRKAMTYVVIKLSLIFFCWNIYFLIVCLSTYYFVEIKWSVQLLFVNRKLKLSKFRVKIHNVIRDHRRINCETTVAGSCFRLEPGKRNSRAASGEPEYGGARSDDYGRHVVRGARGAQHHDVGGLDGGLGWFHGSGVHRHNIEENRGETGVLGPGIPVQSRVS